MIEVFGVMPSCRISCTPMTAPNRHRMTRKTKVAGAKVEGCCWVPAAGVGGAPPGTAVARDRSLIGMPQIAADGRLRYRMAGPVLPMVLWRRTGRGRVLHRWRLCLSSAPGAGVAQWQSRSFPSLRRGFDSLHPLHLRAPIRKHGDEQHGGDHCEA